MNGIDTPNRPSLLTDLRSRISKNGPISVAEYMQDCLTNPQWGYYKVSSPLGKDGDFITAPEISQMFGEFIGAWCIHMWHQLGRPNPFSIVELGPGHGTLITDMWRTFVQQPDISDACVHCLVEASQILTEHQKRTLHKIPRTTWHNDLSTIPHAPTIFLANEFFDALPIHQYLFTENGWHERLIGCDQDGQLTWTTDQTSHNHKIPRLALNEIPRIGAVFESSPERERVMQSIARHLNHHSGCALVIDYGFTGPRLGDTFQAVSHHHAVDPLLRPGEVDISSHVDFFPLAQIALRTGITPHGPMPQGSFLQKLGIEFRAKQLIQAQPTHAQEILSGLTRLISPQQMGELFQVMAFTSPKIPTPPPFPGW